MSDENIQLYNLDQQQQQRQPTPLHVYNIYTEQCDAVKPQYSHHEQAVLQGLPFILSLLVHDGCVCVKQEMGGGAVRTYQLQLTQKGRYS